MDLRKIEYVFFDLDGTITEPFNGITKSVEYSLSKYGIKVEDRKELKAFIGPPLKPSYMKYYGFDEEKAIEAVAFYREYYSAGGMYDCELYNGADKLLKDMSEKYKLVLATSKPQPFAEKILEKFDLKKYFYHIVGATFDDKVSEKADVIRKALSDLDASPEKAVMIGDRFYDTDGAAENGMPSIGVTYGYGKRKEFGKAEKIFDSIEEIYKFFCE
ncbi:MAG: HAD hydrolase-like protein [Clostridia bacterium]|nr:HAD hydrolase-like protein [Clostridia bacterium]